MATFNPVEAHGATSQRLKETLSAEVKADRKTMPFTYGLLAGLFRGLGVVSANAAAHIAALEKRVAALERQVEGRKGLVYRGVFRREERYDVGDFVTAKGSLWACMSATSEAPGEGSECWRMAVRKGRDAHNARGARNDD